ncbi:MAG: hypothetical protein GXY65_00255 [Rhodococcus sp.]|uniref:hypothetical protein n=1 Tax=Rhodococcus sp. TaxID=1831 RepID=UPI00169D811E|nr:hypothetical protein [Rhodococcus sp. (in: high G+C Gram-positive bacteria)]NLV77782.1 hypothetical protein [Rhodococcus sp. (in: high G+C Gram-positive bacteria)]
MNRQTIVERALYILLPLLAVALLYGLPMLGLNFAVDHGLYVAAASAAVPFARGRGMTFWNVMDRLMDLDPTEDEFREYCGMMHAELKAAAVEAGQLPEMWHALPLWTDEDVERIRAGITAERAELAEMDAEDAERAGLTSTDITHQVVQALGVDARDHDINGIVAAIIDRYGRVSIDAITSTAFWGIVAEHALDSSDARDSSGTTTVSTITAVEIGDRLRLTLDRLNDSDATYELAFGTPDRCGDFPTITPDRIPDLIDALHELHRAYHAHTNA